MAKDPIRIWTRLGSSTCPETGIPRGETEEGHDCVRVLYISNEKESTLEGPGPPGTWHKNRSKQAELGQSQSRCLTRYIPTGWG